MDYPQKIKELTEDELDIKFFLITSMAEQYSSQKLDFDKVMEVASVFKEIKGVEFISILFRMCLIYSDKQFSKDYSKTTNKKHLELIKEFTKYLV